MPIAGRLALVAARLFAPGPAASTIIWSIGLRLRVECREILSHGPLLTLLLGPIEFVGRLPISMPPSALEPKSATLYNARGEVHQARHEFDRAIADFSEAVRLDPKLLHALLNRGNAHKAKGEQYSAIADYVRVIYHAANR